ncbi:hypothetical protein EYF80_022107 [Liparis tanakae]|uniref:Uncharacterized protein n=1 Tax=Liparis tanakae TaxID=230148 RepID=A0A4Z2HRM7_9TELE|nr:hypothetical protein EYF80_022107 [Liparis tanakae]
MSETSLRARSVMDTIFWMDWSSSSEGGRPKSRVGVEAGGQKEFKLILGALTFLTAEAELAAEVNGFLTPASPPLAVGFRYAELEVEEADAHREPLELLRVAVVVLLAAAVVEDDV